MSRKYAARVDRNQSELVNYMRGLGASFQHVHTIAGALDGIVGYQGIDQRVEIKDPNQPLNKQKLTDAEVETFATWRGRTPVIVKTKHDCKRLLKHMMNEAVIKEKYRV